MKPRFSLRTLFVVMTLIAIPFGWRAFNLHRARDCAAKLVSGEIEYRNPQKFRVVNAKASVNNEWREFWLPSLLLTLRDEQDPRQAEYVEVRRQTISGFHFQK